MARTAITVTSMPEPFATVSADAFLIDFDAADVSDKNTAAVTGYEIILAYNSGSTARTIDIDSIADEKNRTADIESYEIAAGEIHAFPMGLATAAGWKQSGDVINLEASNADIQFAVLRLP